MTVSQDQKMDEEEEVEGMDVDGTINLAATEVDEEYLRKVSEDQKTKVATAISSSNFDDGLEMLLMEEKTARKDDRMEDTVFVVLKAVEYCKDKGRWEQLITLLSSFSKRHGQFKQVTQKMTQTVMRWVEECPDEVRANLLDGLLDVSEGKLYLELERARLTMFKCYALENADDIKGAAEVLKDFQVETYGAVEKREKTTYILEQMRIFLKTSDPVYFTRAQIRSGHIGPKTLAKFPDLALKFHRYQIEIHHKEEEFFKMARALLHMRDLVENAKEKDCSATEAVFACILAKFSKEQQQQLFTLSKDQKICDIANCKKLLTLFTTYEIIRWPLEDSSLGDFLNSFSFTVEFGEPKTLVNEFRTRTIQHNIRVAERYYTDITMARLATFLNTDEEEMEKHVSDMVVSGDIHAKIDRLEKQIKFKRLQTPQEIVNTWRNDIDVLVHKVENTCHQIQREQAIAAAKAKAAKAAKRRKK